MKIAVCVLSSTPPEILSDIYGDAVFSFSELPHKRYYFKYDEHSIQLEPGDPVLCQVRSSYCYGKVIRTLQCNDLGLRRAAKYKSIIAKLNPDTLLNDVKSASMLALLTREVGDAKFPQNLLKILGELDISPVTMIRKLKNVNN